MQAFQRIPRNLLRHGAARNVSSSATVVPVIDLGPARRGGEEDKRDVARQIADACEHTGFMSIVNHGIPNDVVNGIWQSTREFFDLPEEEKVASAKMTEEYPVRRRPHRARAPPAHGGSGFSTAMFPSAARFWREARTRLAAGPNPRRPTSRSPSASAPRTRPQVRPPVASTAGAGAVSGRVTPLSRRVPVQLPGMPPIQWPARPTSFRPTYEAYYREMEMLTEDMLGLFARALGLDPAWFEDKIDRHRSVIRSLCVIA